ncbi:MAG: undecaprenyl-phosphate glucose phosphotransferase [Spirochaetes bacterium]|nr:undecaprenyl-phosphate glucose phosphotransferase [Spirochaetota bacterium]
MPKQYNNILLTAGVITDFFILIFAYLLSKYIIFHDISISSWSLRELVITCFILFILFLLLEKFEFSQSDRFKPLSQIIENIVLFELYLVALFYLPILFNIYHYRNEFILLYLIITFFIYFTERVVIKIILILIRKSGYNYIKFLIIGAGNVGIGFFNLIQKSEKYGVKIIGFLDDDVSLTKSKDLKYTDEIKSMIIGKISKLETILKTQDIDNVIVALPMDNTEKISDIFLTCESYGVKAELIPRYLKILSERPSIRYIKRFALIGMHNVPLDNLFNRFIKRLFDICFAVFCLILTSPLFLIITILIKLESKGPVYFTQKRTGFNQKEFNIIKFRTMQVNKEADIKQATINDPRKTVIGTILRKTNLDELPQLINILKGEMSLIGPRPHMIAHTEEFKKKYKKYMIRHWVKPGLTGWAQVNGWRGDSDIQMRVKYDIDYIENWSLWFDLKIVFLTFFSKKAKIHAH